MSALVHQQSKIIIKLVDLLLSSFYSTVVSVQKRNNFLNFHWTVQCTPIAKLLICWYINNIVCMSEERRRTVIFRKNLLMPCQVTRLMKSNAKK